MNTKAKLSIRAVIRWEQMSGRSFMNINFSDDDDMLRLLYCATVICADKPFTFDQFMLAAKNKQVLSASVRAVEAYNAFTHQFARKQTEPEDQTNGDDTLIGKVAAKLIIAGGMDARFVMDEMLIEDLPMYLEALSDRMKQEEESRRLWAYNSIRPHVNGRVINSPQKMHVFPWEVEQEVRRAHQEMQSNEDALRQFLAGDMIDINNIKWTKREN